MNKQNYELIYDWIIKHLEVYNEWWIVNRSMMNINMNNEKSMNLQLIWIWLGQWGYRCHYFTNTKYEIYVLYIYDKHLLIFLKLFYEIVFFLIINEYKSILYLLFLYD